ncbi:outer membrane lipoprotein LolB [Pseudomaricurvus alkylphenolicus]|jgi:outer membrane lipoprotein LolB|uniref:lipoprotein insertase outer membrane protein LolB n=1 Tax=Pseudomaricurvus alkylphenolicus TaxID=1306991 RepID=UPI00141F111E|nr:lipoprotein insertase outer membrane protein LolB [Pseudomaricurvus alkylphenolicus]NIB40141.1 outer membrane lipoprotein LolB [Pseudomaricurvus alkylphenolicus]
MRHSSKRPLSLSRAFVQLCLLLVVFAGLAGCASHSPYKSTNPAQTLAELQQWQLKGKLGIRAPGQSGSAYFDWRQEIEHYRIQLTGPFGQGATRIVGRDGGVTLEQGDQPPLHADTPEALMYDAMGWWLPVSELHYWVRGLPAPNSAFDEIRDETTGLLQQLQQRGWTLNYKRFEQQGPWQLPARLTASRDQIRLTFIIKDWQLD